MTRTPRYVATLLALVTGAAVASVVATSPASAATVPTKLQVGSALYAGDSLRSPNGAYTATVTRGGRFVVRHRGHALWSRHIGAHPRVGLRRGGNLVFMSGRRMVWSTNTARAGALVLGNHGVLALRSPGGVVWSDQVGNACRGGAPGKRVVVDLSFQFARLCNGGTQVLTTAITSGATDLGNGTPTGTWRVQGMQRDTYLYPAAGGVYYVHFWIPYDGAYGMHDSPWQHFAYGSSRYRTQGSHGCVHFPYAAIAWMYRWIRVGTLVRIRS
jgi:lipoprotein-anchoring transpeptidase ErfK/SrfK